MTETLPRPFGRYVLTSLLGEGGMGRVYRATLTGPSGFRKEVALKVIRPGERRDLAAVTDAFIREAQVCGLLRHLNVVDVYDFGVTHEQPWLAMELIDGWPLDALLAQHPKLPATVALDLAIQIAEGLRHAHELTQDGERLALVHRDLKPGNVLVSREGVAKVMDFGLARATAGDEAMTMSGVVRGTPAYMSPEQAGGEELDPRSDLFSFGVMLYELADGARPFIRDNLMAQIMALVQVETSLADPAFLAGPEARVPGISEVLRRLLRRSPVDRYDRSRDLLSALRELLHRQPAGPSLRSFIDAVLLGNSASPAFELGSRAQYTGSATLPAPAALSAGTGFAATGASQGFGVRTNLAPDGGAFVGREEDLAGLDGLVEEGARLVSVVGPAGTGKTRLARAWASARFEELLPLGGVWFCDLAGATDLLSVVAAVAAPLGVPLDQAAGEDAALDQVGFAIAGRGRVLLVLDNLEQVVQPAGVAAKRWLALAGSALLIATSRERLRVAGERVLELGPLGEEAAVQLFRERARAARPDFAVTDAVQDTVLRIVRRLDCIPLAIELAAARSAVLEPAAILERLAERWKLLRARRGEGPERQATLRDAIDWSWNLLDPSERAALAQCSVFRGGFDLAAAEQVVELDDGWALDAIEALRDKSLVRAEQRRELGGAVRFALYESIREFASEQLDDGARTAAWRAHAEHFLSWGEARLQEVDGPEARKARRGLALELDNLHAVFTRFVQLDPRLAVRAALVMSPVLMVTGPLQGHMSLLEQAVEAAARLADSGPDALLRAQILSVRGRMRHVRSSLAEAEADLLAAVALAEAESARRLQGDLMGALAALSLDRGDFAEAEARYEEQRRIGEASQDRVLLADALGLRGRIEGHDPKRFEQGQASLEQAIELQLGLGRLPQAAQLMQSLAVAHAQALRNARATELLRRALEVHRDLGNRRGQATCLANLGLLAVQTGDVEQARSDLDRSLRMHTRIGARRAIGILRMNLGVVTLLGGDAGEAIRMLREALAEMERSATPFYLGAGWRYLGSMLHLEGRWGEAADAYTQAATVLAKDEAGWMMASALGCQAALAADQDRFVEADVLLGQADAKVLDGSGTAFVSLCRGHLELAQARTLLEMGEDEGAEELFAAVRVRLRNRGFEEPPAPHAPQEATNRLASALLSQTLERSLPASG